MCIHGKEAALYYSGRLLNALTKRFWGGDIDKKQVVAALDEISYTQHGEISIQSRNLRNRVKDSGQISDDLRREIVQFAASVIAGTVDSTVVLNRAIDTTAPSPSPDFDADFARIDEPVEATVWERSGW